MQDIIEETVDALARYNKHILKCLCFKGYVAPPYNLTRLGPASSSRQVAPGMLQVQGRALATPGDLAFLCESFPAQ